MPVMRSRISLLTVSMAIGIGRVSGALFSVVQTSQPESSGIMTSSRIRSGLASIAFSTPSRPLRARMAV